MPEMILMDNENSGVVCINPRAQLVSATSSLTITFYWAILPELLHSIL